LISNKPVIVIGAGGHARVLISSLKASRREISGILDPDVKLIGQTIAGIPVLGNDETISNYAPDSVELVNGIGSVATLEKRKAIYMKFKNAGYSFARVVHPSAAVMEDVQLGEGVQIMAGAVVQTGCTIGNNAVINTGALIDHDCIIGAHVHIAPGAVLSGGVAIGEMSHIGAAATIIQGIKIAERVVVGAGAVAIKDITTGKKVAGNPAKDIQQR